MRPLDWVRSGNNVFTASDAVLFQFQDFGDLNPDGIPMESGDIPLDPNGVHENRL